MFITFLTDFGLQDDFVGTCHGVMKRLAPEAQIIDITHGIGPQQVLQGAFVLANTLPYMPQGVHLAVVDPGVGTKRRSIAIRGGDGRLYVGPDNGLLLPAVEKLGGIAAAHEITEREFALEPISSTFHGRDVFSPAAAHLALGVEIERLGPSLAATELVRLHVPEPTVGSNRIRATVLDVDRFGNVQLNLTLANLQSIGLEPGTQIELEVSGERYFAVAARTFADAKPGDILLYEDAYGNIAVAISGGNAATMLAARLGLELRIHPAP